MADGPKAGKGEKPCPQCAKMVRGKRANICPYCAYSFVKKGNAEAGAKEEMEEGVDGKTNDEMRAIGIKFVGFDEETVGPVKF